jgi:hypothetical protein
VTVTEQAPRIPAGISDQPPAGQTLASRRGRLRTATEWLLSGGSALFFGPAGVGKSAALDVLAAAATQSRILRHAPGADDAGRAFSTLAGLLSSVTPAELDPVPPARRRALPTAATAGQGTAATGQGWATPAAAGQRPATPAATRLAALNLFRVLARSRPLLLIVDDLQWVDELSADTLRFVASRVEDLPVRMAASERVDPGCLPLWRALCPAPLLVVRLDTVVPAPVTDEDGWREPGWLPGSCPARSEERTE